MLIFGVGTHHDPKTIPSSQLLKLYHEKIVKQLLFIIKIIQIKEKLVLLLVLSININKLQELNFFVHTWKYKMIVQINPRTTGGRPSTRSLALMLTNFIRLPARN